MKPSRLHIGFPRLNLDADVDMRIAVAGCDCDSCRLHLGLALMRRSEAGDAHFHHGTALVDMDFAHCVERREGAHDQ